jgi:SSS family solute:Na+ symporter
MAGNVTAFNTVWTYDIYQSYIKKDGTDEHYVWVGKMATIFGILLSMAAAYPASKFNNIMDMLQLVFAFVNAPLLATFLLGMFWKRTTATAAFWGLLLGTLTAALHHGFTQPVGATTLIKGGWTGQVLHVYASDMGQNFWTSIWAWSSCFSLTILISLLTKRDKTDEQLRGLVYSLTPIQNDSHIVWYKQPALLGSLVMLGAIVLNIIFW